MSTRSNSAATDRHPAVWIALGAALAMGVATVRLSTPSSSAALPVAAHTAYDPAASQAPALRVLVVPHRSEPIRVAVAGPYRVTAVGDWRVLAQGVDLPEAEVLVTETGLQIGPRQFECDRLELDVVRPGTLTVDGVRYQGHLRLLRHGSSAALAVNVLDLEQYVADVAAGYASDRPDLPDAAWEALAITARSYAMYRTKTVGADQPWDLRADAEGFAYRGAGPSGETSATALPRRAAWRTRGIVLTYQGRLFCPLATDSCGGHTLDATMLYHGAAPPLVGVACSACRDDDETAWEVRLPAARLREQLAEHLARCGRAIGPVQRIETPETSSGSLPELQITGAEGEARLSTRVFRHQVVGAETLPGTQFAVRLDADQYVLTGRGRGHGAGLCWHGAAGQALAGRRSPEILAHYFPGSALTAVR